MFDRIFRKPPTADAADDSLNATLISAGRLPLLRPAQPAPDVAASEAALKAFLDTPDFDTTRVVLEQQQAVLLHPATALVLLRRLANTENPVQREMLALHLGILMVARDQGVAAAWAWKDAWLKETLAHQQAAMEEAFKRLAPEDRREVERLLALLGDESLSEATRQQVMQDIARKLQGGAGPSGRPTPPPETIEQALQAFLRAETWDATFAALEQNRDALLNDTAIDALRGLTERVRAEQPDSARDLIKQLWILETAQAQGVEATRRAFDRGDWRAAFGEATPASAASPVVAVTPPAGPAITIQAVERYLAGVGAVDAQTARALRAWLGEGDATASAEEIQAALQQVRAYETAHGGGH